MSELNLDSAEFGIMADICIHSVPIRAATAPSLPELRGLQLRYRYPSIQQRATNRIACRPIACLVRQVYDCSPHRDHRTSARVCT